MSIREVFDKSAGNYDADRELLIPCYNDYYATALDIIPFSRDREIRVLDLGSGTGALARLIAEKYPRAQLQLVDIAPAMLQVAETHFSTNDLDRVSFRVMDYVREDFQGPYDLIASSLSIHHLPDEQKQKLFNKIFRALVPGGFFVNADQARGESEFAENIFSRAWIRQVKERGVTDATLQATLERMKEDKMSPLSSQFSWLRQSGFIDVSTWYQYYSFVVYSATRPLTTGGSE